MFKMLRISRCFQGRSGRCHLHVHERAQVGRDVLRHGGHRAGAQQGDRLRQDVRQVPSGDRGSVGDGGPDEGRHDAEEGEEGKEAEPDDGYGEDDGGRERCVNLVCSSVMRGVLESVKV